MENSTLLQSTMIGIYWANVNEIAERYRLSSVGAVEEITDDMERTSYTGFRKLINNVSYMNVVFITQFTDEEPETPQGWQHSTPNCSQKPSRYVWIH